MPSHLTNKMFSTGQIVIKGKPAENAETSTFQIDRSRTGLRTRRNDMRTQHREREARLQEMEDARINGIREQMLQAVNENARLKERRHDMQKTSDSILAGIHDLAQRLPSVRDESEDAQDQRIASLIEQGLLQEGFSEREYHMLMIRTVEEMDDEFLRLAETGLNIEELDAEIATSDAFTEKKLARLENLIEDMLKAREERQQLHFAIEFKLQQLEQEEENYERKEKIEERRAALNGETVGQRNTRPLALDIMGARIDALHLLSFSRDELTAEALRIEPIIEEDSDKQLPRIERLYTRISRLNNTIERKLRETDHNTLQDAMLLHHIERNNASDNEDESASMIDVQL